MNKIIRTTILLFFVFSGYLVAQSQCAICHSGAVDNNSNTWLTTHHAESQHNAPELAGDVGHSPEEQIADEDCISCHGPRAVRANGGMTEAEALGYFYTTATESGVADDGTPYDVGDFYPGTVNQNESEWPNINCQTCHDYDTTATSMPTLKLALFDSHYLDPSTQEQGVAKPVNFPHELCGQCHGSLHEANQGTDDTFDGGGFYEWANWAAQNPSLAGNWKGTNHLLTDGWKFSKHSRTQDDAAIELGEERAGETPDEVVNGSDPENCIACHAPTAVEANGGMTESEALNYFFTTTDGKFTENTAVKNADEWPDVDCVNCHDPHNGTLSYYNSSTKKHVPMASSDELCGQCHGTLRFPDTDHLSYNIMQGTGGIGVDDQKTMSGATCVDCHMAVDRSTWPGEHHFNQYMTHGHTFQIIVNGGDKSHHPENHPGWTGWSMGALAGDMADYGDGPGNGDAPHVASCTTCHAYMDAQVVRLTVEGMQNEYANLDSIANVKVAAAEDFLIGSSDSIAIDLLEEAQFNIAFAEGDESGGVHNHNYTIALLNDVIEKSDFIITGLYENMSPVRVFALHQNYPNPFNPSTTIEYQTPKEGFVNLTVYNMLGQKVTTLVNANIPSGKHHIVFNASDLTSGVYFYKLTAGTLVSTKKLLLLK